MWFFFKRMLPNNLLDGCHGVSIVKQVKTRMSGQNRVGPDQIKAAI